MKTTLSVCTSCYNEVKRGVPLDENVGKIVEALRHSKYAGAFEVILLDDKSPGDNTAEAIARLAKRFKEVRGLYHEKNTGRGKGVTDALLEAQGDIIGFLDIDLETPLHYLFPVVEEIENGFDVAIAQRHAPFTTMRIHREIASGIFSKLVKTVLKIPVTDTEVGFKFFKREKILPILKQCKEQGWNWDTEIMARSYHAGLKIKEVPTLFIRQDVESTVNLFKDSMDFFKNVFKIRRMLKEEGILK